MSLMSAFYVANSGLNTSQNALNTVSHNLSNVNTAGYTRQQVLETTGNYTLLSYNPNSVANKQIGLGTIYAATRQVRDYFLDQSYRKEIGRSAFYETSYETMTEIEALFGELEGATFSTSLDNLWVAAQELYKDPTSSVTQNLLVQRASQFVEASKAVYEGLCNYQNNLNVKVSEKVEQINGYAKQLYDLNHQIVRIEAGGVEHANDLRDSRNYILDQLGSLGNISYSEDINGYVTVKLEGNVLVNGEYVDEIGLLEDEETGFYTPYWTREAKYSVDKLTKERVLESIEGAKLFDLKQEISTNSNTDIGELKAIYFARGDRHANYTDISDSYDLDVSQSIIMNVQAEYDQLIHNVVTALNTVIYDAAKKEPQTDYLKDENGNPLELFQRVKIDSYDENGRYIEEEKDKVSTLFTCSNLKVNVDLLQKPTKLSFKLQDGSEDLDTCQKLLDAFSYDGYKLNQNVQTSGNFTKYYSNLISQVANSGSVFSGVCDNQQTTVSAVDSARDQIIGVSSDEELSNMIRFQNAYNANSRFFNVVNEMLGHLLTSM